MLALAHYPSDGSGSAAARRNPVQGPPKGGPEHNRAIAIPGTSPAKGRIAKNLRRIAGDVHCLKPCVSKESDLAAIGRPEWKARSSVPLTCCAAEAERARTPQGCFSVISRECPRKRPFSASCPCFCAILVRNPG